MGVSADDDTILALTARIAALEGNHGVDDDAPVYLSAADANAFWLLFGMVLVFFMQARTRGVDVSRAGAEAFFRRRASPCSRSAASSSRTRRTF